MKMDNTLSDHVKRSGGTFDDNGKLRWVDLNGTSGGSVTEDRQARKFHVQQPNGTNCIRPNIPADTKALLNGIAAAITATGSSAASVAMTTTTTIPNGTFVCPPETPNAPVKKIPAK